MKITAVYDKKSEAFLRPQFNVSLPDARRAWEIAVNDADSMLSRFPDDFVLYHVADFDAETGNVTQVEHANLGSGSDYKNKPESVLPMDEHRSLNSGRNTRHT